MGPTQTRDVVYKALKDGKYVSVTTAPEDIDVFIYDSDTYKKRQMLKQKLLAIGIVFSGLVIWLIDGRDATALIFSLMLGLPLLFSRKIWVS